jgi:hypothetical protein
MDSYPDAFNRTSCIDIMTKQQALMIKETRQHFYDTIMRLTDKCESVMVLEFPDKLWFEHKHTLIKEILERFGKIKIKILSRPADATIPITNIELVPKDSGIKMIILEFPGE